MTTIIEAKRLSGIDIGKTVTLNDGDTGTLTGINHGTGHTSIYLASPGGGRRTIHASPNETLSITGIAP